MIEGFVHPDFGRVTEALRRSLRHPRGGGAAVCVYHHGEKVVDAWAGARDRVGDPWRQDTMAMSFSTTKGVVATAVHRLVDRGLLGYDDPVAEYWPEFAQGGKETVTVRHLLSHSAGLHHLRGVIDDAHVMLDWDAICAALAAEAPRYTPGEKHGYHGITYGFLVGEVLRRVTGKSVHDVVQDEIVRPLGLDGMHIGTKPEHRGRLAEPIMSFGRADRLEDLAARLERVRWLRPAIETFAVAEFDRLLMSERVHEGELPALNGCFTARSLARMYGALANGGSIDGIPFLSPETLRQAATVQTRSRDIVVGIRMQWRLGYHMAGTTRGILANGFGHFGYGGSGAWADTERGLAVAMVCNRVAGTPFGDLRLPRIGAAAVRAASSR